MKKYFDSVLGKTIFLLLMVQIMTGIFWIAKSLGTQTGLIVEEGGPLYVLLLPVLRDMGKGFFLIQTVACLFAFDYLFQSVWKLNVWFRCVRVLGILTCPGMLLTLFSVNPYGIAAVGMALLSAVCILSAVGKLEAVKGFLMGALLMVLLSAWLQECIVYVLPVFVIIAGAAWKRKRKKGRGWQFGCLCMIIVMVSWIPIALTAHSPQRSEDMKPFMDSLVTRISQTHITLVYGNYPEKVQSVVSQDALEGLDVTPESMEKTVIKPVKEVYGSSEGTRLLLQTAKAVWEGYAPEIEKEIALDFVSYLVTPVMVLYRVMGHGTVSRVKRLQEYLILPAPRAARLLTYIPAAVFILGAVWFGLRICFGRGNKKSDPERKIFRGIFVIFALLISLWYTFQGGGSMDYRKNIFLTALEIGTLLSLITGDIEKEA